MTDYTELERLAKGALSAKGDNARWEALDALESAANPQTVLSLLSELSLLEEARAKIDVLEVERIGLRAAIFGSHDYDPALRHGNFVEMARQTEEARKGAVTRAETAERQRDEARQKAFNDMADAICEVPLTNSKRELVKAAFRSAISIINSGQALQSTGGDQ